MCDENTDRPIEQQHHEQGPEKDRVLIFDTSLRDGEQSPGAAMTLPQKLEIARALAELRVDIIEAGFPISSVGDFQSVAKIAKEIKGPRICALARCGKADIERAVEALQQAASSRIHVFLATSPLHMKYKLQMEPEDVYGRLIDSVRFARNFVDDVEWSPEDASRSDHDFLCRCVEGAIDAGATTINIPDTVGYAVPDEYRSLIAMLFDRVPNIDKACVSVHCHDDLGLAVANSLAALQAGARQIECTVNGIGERAGNTSLEEVVVALRTRRDALPYWTGVDTRVITRISRLISTSTGMDVQPNKAIVGANAFAHESGIHQDGMLKHAGTYEIVDPESIGLHKSSLVLGKLSGRHAFRDKLIQLGYQLGDNALADAFVRFKSLADHKRHIYDEDVIALVDDSIGSASDRYRIVSLAIRCGTGNAGEADLVLEIDGVQSSTTGRGNGPFDAIFHAVRALVPHDATLQLFQIKAITEGTDAQAEVVVRLEENGLLASGQGADADTMVAAARATVHALSQLLARKHKSNNSLAQTG